MAIGYHDKRQSLHITQAMGQPEVVSDTVASLAIASILTWLEVLYEHNLLSLRDGFLLRCVQRRSIGED